MQLKKFLLFFATFTHQTHTDTVTINNHTRYPIYAALYSVKTTIWGTSIGPATQQCSVIEIPAQDQGFINREGLVPLENRELIFSTKQTDLATTLDFDAYKKATKYPASWPHGATYHIAEQEKTLHCYPDIEWYTIKPLIDQADLLIEKMLKKIQKICSQHPYCQTKAFVRLTTDLCQQEKTTVSKRMQVTHKAIEKILSTTIPQHKTPRIALCLSGGGMRATICSCALVTGLNDIGLLDTITYCASLSGSTWFLTDWITLGQPIALYQKHLINALSQISIFSLDTLSSILWPKYIFRQETGIIDLYGAYLAHTFLQQTKDHIVREKITFSSLHSSIKEGLWPFPLCTAIENSITPHWITCTPYEIGSDSLHFQVPTWAFGRKFIGGISTDYAPEQSLGFFMGLWGSALSGSLQDFLDTQVEQLNPLLFHALNTTFIKTGISDIHLAAIKINNPLYGLEESSYRVRNMHDLFFMDSAYAYNIPLPPLFKKERAIDIIIIMDASQDVHKETSDFKKAITDLRAQGILLPTIDFTKKIQKSVTVFADPKNAKTVTIIYIMPNKEDHFDQSFEPAKEFYTTYKTTRFSYTQKEIEKLVELIHYSITTNKSLFVGAIKSKIS